MKRLIAYLIIIVVFFLMLSLWGFYISIRPTKIESSTTPADYALDYEEIYFKTEDNLNLKGWFIPHQAPDTAKTIIILHGYPADKGDIMPATRFLNEKYNLFFFDFRYLGESGGKYSTAGAKETEDLMAAIRFLKSRGINEVGAFGFSMGGAVAIMAAPDAPEIRAIVSDSAYANLELMVYEIYRIPALDVPLAYLTNIWAKLFLGLDIKNTAPAKSAENLSIPALIIHSTRDDVIPFKNALLIQQSLKNNPKAEFWFKEDYFHGELGQNYQERILDFFERNL